jgi:hypothetical protein
VATPKPVYEYTRRGRVYKSSTKLTVSQLAAMVKSTAGTPLRKAASDALVPIFDATGQLVGMCKPGDVVEVAKPASSSKTAQANIANDPNHPASAEAQVAKTLTASVSNVRFDEPATFAKSAGSTTSTRWSALLKAAGPAASQLQTAVTFAAVKLSTAHGLPAAKALQIAQEAALTAASSRTRA